MVIIISSCGDINKSAKASFLNVRPEKVLGALLSGIEACLRFFKVSERLKNPNTDTVHVMEDILLV
jgi:hypothetical protein